jgi:hypothetical protein
LLSKKLKPASLPMEPSFHMRTISSSGWKTLVMLLPSEAIMDELISAQRLPGGQACCFMIFRAL